MSRTLEVGVGGSTIRGSLGFPEGPGPFPAIVRAPGWMSSAGAAHYRAYDEGLISAGFAVFAVDYRGTGASEPSDEAGRPFQMVEDLLAATAVLCDIPEVDPSRVGIFGTGGVGAGAAIAAASLDRRLRATAVMSAIADGRRWLSGMRTPEQWNDLLEAQARDRGSAGRSGQRGTIAPIGGILLPPAVRARVSFKADVGAQVPQHVSRGVVDELMLFTPDSYAAQLSPRALLLISCEADPVVPDDHARSIYESASSPKGWLVLKNTDSYRAHTSHGTEITTALATFFGSHLAPGGWTRLEDPVDG